MSAQHAAPRGAALRAVRHNRAMRLYVPATLDELDSATVTAGGASWTVPSRPAHAVTAALQAAEPDEDEEGLEYLAFLAAADDSLLLVAESPSSSRLRVVVTVEVPDALVHPARDEGHVASQVCVHQDHPDTAIVAIHVDEPEAAVDVADVIQAAATDGPEGDAALQDAIQRVTDRDLLWYAPEELLLIPRS